MHHKKSPTNYLGWIEFKGFSHFISVGFQNGFRSKVQYIAFFRQKE